MLSAVTKSLALVLVSIAACPLSAQAAEPAPVQAHAILVGSHRPGPGQQLLRFSGQDAQRVAEVLSQLGGYPEGQVHVLTDPDPGQLLAEIGAVGRTIAEQRARGEQTSFLFYYSGHARSRALNLGEARLPLELLRERLEGLGATLTLVILDACQAGAISQVKGVAPAADFSHNSVHDLNAEGLVVMASSAATELSQESADLAGSFFTHHLVVGLRGAADADGDGRVTLSEAYTYAYNRTLVSTAATAVGRQHVTLETDLRGRGEMVLTRPALANAHLVLPEDLSAEILVHRRDNRVVVAEVHKAAGSDLRLALPAGDYTALVRQAETVFRCPVALQAERRLTLGLAGCDEVPVELTEAKGEPEAPRPLERMGFELALGGLADRRDAYLVTLEDFGFERSGLLFDDPPLGILAQVNYALTDHLAVLAQFSTLDYGEYHRDLHEMSGDIRPQRFEWRAYRVGLGFRAGLPLLEGWLVPYAQAGVGLSIGRADFVDGGSHDPDTHFGYHLSVGGGLQLMPTILWWRYLGAFVQAEYIYAPTIDNLVGQTHDSGGFALYLGMRGAF